MVWHRIALNSSTRAGAFAIRVSSRISPIIFSELSFLLLQAVKSEDSIMIVLASNLYGVKLLVVIQMDLERCHAMGYSESACSQVRSSTV